MATVLLGIGFVGLFFGLMAVRLIFLKDGEFKGTCASQSPFLKNDGVTCSLCGKNPTDCDSNSGEEIKGTDKELVAEKR